MNAEKNILPQSATQTRNPWTVLHKKNIYDNNWIEVSHHEVLNPNRNEGIYGLVHFKNLAIGIVPYDSEGNIWLVGQYRFPIQQYSWEIVEGGGQIGIDPILSAQRELLEETGIVAQKYLKIVEMHLSNSVSDELGMVFLVTNLTFQQAEPEDTEQLTVIKIPFETAYLALQNGEITDSLSVAALLKIKIMKLEGQLI